MEITSSEASIDVSLLTSYGTTYRMYKSDGSYEVGNEGIYDRTIILLHLNYVKIHTLIRKFFHLSHMDKRI